MPSIPARTFRTYMWIASAIVAGVIAYLSLVPAESVPGPHVYDKIRHFLAYGVLSVPASLAFGPKRRLAAFLTCAIFGICLEVAQMITPYGREGSWGDAVANMLGAGLGLWLSAVLRRLYGLFSRNSA